MHRLYENIEGQCSGQVIKATDSSPDLNAYSESAEEFNYGIYSPEDAVMIGTAHNEGTMRLPKREFINVSETTEEKLVDHIADRILRRLVTLGENVERSG
jgi:hypothetical protein